MGKFSKIKKYSKPSLEVNERIEKLNKELEKTGVLFEAPANSTSGLYTEPSINIPQPDSWTTLPEPDIDTSGLGSGHQTFTTSSGESNLDQFLYTDPETGVVYRRLEPYEGKPEAKYGIAFALSWDATIVGYIGDDGFVSTGSLGPSGGFNDWGKYGQLWIDYKDEMPVVGWIFRKSGFYPSRWFQIRMYVGAPNTQKIPVNKRLDDPDYLPVLDRNNNNKKRGPKDPWEELKKRLKAGKEWMDYMMDKRLRGKRKRMIELLGQTGKKALGKFGELMGFVEDKIEELVGDSLDKAVGTASAGATLGAFWDQQEGNVKYDKNNPYEVPYGQTQKQEISNAFEKALDYTDNMGFDLKGKIDRGEQFTQQEIDFLNQKMNYEFGSTTPEGFGFYRTFGKFSPNLEITKNDNGGYDIKDNYVFDNLNDFEGGQIEIGGVKFGPGVKGEYYARKDRGDIDFYDKEPNQPDAKRIGSIKQMFIKTSLPPSSSMKEEIAFEDVEKQLILEELQYDQLIEKLEKQRCLTKQEQTYKTIKRVSSATKDPSPILETKTIQTEQKSPARFLVKEKKEDTSRARWLKRA